MKKLSIAAFLLFLCMLSSCSGEDQPSSDIADKDTSDDRSDESVQLPDYMGADFCLLVRTEYAHEFNADEENGDLLNDAVYQRNLAVEQAYNININVYDQPCSYGSEATAFNTTVKASVLSGSGEYDLVAGYAATIPALVGEKLFLNWVEGDLIDFSQPWWSKKVADELTINGKAFMITGDLSVALWENMNCVLFNKRLAEAYVVEDLYKLTSDGKWTLDRLNAYTAMIYDDIDGDETKSTDDLFGYLSTPNAHIDMFQEAFEVYVTEKGQDGFPEFALNTPHTVEVLEKVISFVHENPGSFFTIDISNAEPVCNTIFSSGRSLFYSARLGMTVQLRDMKDDFGILPYPKFNEEQTEYHSTARDQFTVFVIPADAKDPDMTRILTDALSKASYEQVIPTFYDVVLKTKAARDDESGEMIDLIRDGLVFNFGYLHSTAMGSPGHIFAKLAQAGTLTLSSRWATGEAGFNEKLEDILKIYR